MSHSSRSHTEHRSEHRPEHQSGHTAHRHAEERGSNGPRVEAQVRGSTDEIAGYLTALADAMRSGGVQIRVGDRAVGMHLADELSLELRAEPSEKQANRISLRITWETATPRAATAGLHISSLQASEQQADDQSSDSRSALNSGLNADASTTTNTLPPLWTPSSTQTPGGEEQHAGEGQAASPTPAEGETPGSDAGI